MSENVLKVGLVALVIAGLLAASTARTEYARIQARIETTQAKVDALADELTETTGTIHAAIRALTDRFIKQKSVEIIEHPQAETIEVFAPPITPTIIMHSGYSCGPCNAWIATEQSKWELVGWKVEVVKELDSTRGWPWYEITDRDGKPFQVDGWLTYDSFHAAKRSK